MDNERSGQELLLSDTSIPDVFLVQYAPSLGRDALFLYLFLCMNAKGRSFCEEDINEMKFMAKRDILKALAELLSNDLLSKDKDGRYALIDLKKREADEYVKVCLARGGAAGADIPGLTRNEDEINILSNSISKTFYFGKMPLVFYRLIDKCLYEYGFEPEVVYKLFEEGTEEKKQLRMVDMENMARDWFNRGCTKLSALNEMVDRKKRVKELISVVGKLTRTKLNGLDIERITYWVEKLDVTPDLVDYAFRVNEYKGKITLKHVEDKLTEWNLADIRTVDAAMEYEEKRHEENKAGYYRKKSRTNSWVTAQEASKGGAHAAADKKPVADDGEGEGEGDGKVQDIILDLFGGEDDSDI